MFYSGCRVRIRYASELDADLFAAWATDPLFARYQPLAWHVPDYREHWLWRLKTLRGVNPPLEYEVIVEDARSALPLGAILLSSVDQLNRKAELSAYFSRRKGTRSVFEALHAALHGAFERLNLRKVTCHYTLENRNVARLLSDLSFATEGRLCGELIDRNGESRDLMRAALFQDQWRAEVGPRQVLQAIAPLDLSGFPE